MNRFIKNAIYRGNQLKKYLGRPRLLIQDRPVVISEQNSCRNPIFIIGVHRSGTSLTRRIFDTHSNIACPPETYFMKYFAEMIRDEYTFAGFDGFGYDRKKALHEIGKLAGRFHEAFRLSQNKTRWADKTPQYISILPELNLLFGGEERYVLVKRHPYDVAHSLIRKGWKFGEYSENPAENAALYIKDMWTRMDRFAAQNAGLCTTIYYEHLCSDLRGSLEPALNAVGEQWEDRLQYFSQFNHNFGTEDPTARAIADLQLSYGNWVLLEKDVLETVYRILLPLLKDTPYTDNPAAPPVFK